MVDGKNERTDNGKPNGTKHVVVTNPDGDLSDLDDHEPVKLKDRVTDSSSSSIPLDSDDPDIQKQASIMSKITEKMKVPGKVVAIIMAGINVGLLIFDIFRMWKDLRGNTDKKGK